MAMIWKQAFLVISFIIFQKIRNVYFSTYLLLLATLNIVMQAFLLAPTLLFIF